MLSKVFFAAATACGLFVSSVQGHMVITSPVPYGESSLTNSPLEPDGSDFPCKQRSGVYDVTTMNNMPVGVPQKLAFKGGATHGGGSCQVSVTLDKEPTKDSDWRVVHSIIGGCPSSAPGNADGSPNYLGASQFEFSIPKGMPNGEYTLAWTWFNKIGNREMYMNCAPITVTGGADNNDVFDTLPTMFKANVPADQCTTTEGTDVSFPNPGAYVETGQSATPGKPSGPSCGASGSGGYGGSPAGSSAAPSSEPAAASSEVPAATEAPAAGNGTDSGSAEATAAPAYPPFPIRGGAKGVDNGAILTATTLKTIVASEPAPAAGTGAAQAPSYSPSEGSSGSDTGSSDAGNSSAATGSCSDGAVSCPTPGSVVCIGSSQWGLCDINNCAVPRELSAGTSCSAGVVAKRHVLEHVRRHSHHARRL